MTAQGAADDRERAWEYAFKRYAGVVWKCLRKFRLPDDVAHDLFQSTWLVAVEKLEFPLGEEDMPRFLASTAFWKARGWTRPGRKRPEDLTAELADAIFGREETAEDIAQAAERAQLVIECVQALPPRYRQVLELLFGLGLTYREVADAMGIKVEGVGPLRQRALDRLLSLLRLRGLLDDDVQRPGDRPRGRKRGKKPPEQEPPDGSIEPTEPVEGKDADQPSGAPQSPEPSDGGDESDSA